MDDKKAAEKRKDLTTRDIGKGWSELKSATTGRVYYFHKESQASQWERPAGCREDDDGGDMRYMNGHKMDYDSLASFSLSGCQTPSSISSISHSGPLSNGSTLHPSSLMNPQLSSYMNMPPPSPMPMFPFPPYGAPGLPPGMPPGLPPPVMQPGMPPVMPSQNMYPHPPGYMFNQPKHGQSSMLQFSTSVPPPQIPPPPPGVGGSSRGPQTPTGIPPPPPPLGQRTATRTSSSSLYASPMEHSGATPSSVAPPPPPPPTDQMMQNMNAAASVMNSRNNSIDYVSSPSTSNTKTEGSIYKRDVASMQNLQRNGINNNIKQRNQTSPSDGAPKEPIRKKPSVEEPSGLLRQRNSVGSIHLKSPESEVDTVALAKAREDPILVEHRKRMAELSSLYEPSLGLEKMRSLGMWEDDTKPDTKNLSSITVALDARLIGDLVYYKGLEKMTGSQEYSSAERQGQISALESSIDALTELIPIDKRLQPGFPADGI